MATYQSGFVKQGRQGYFYIKNTETGGFENDCTRYLKHKAKQNRSINTVKRIARILPFYMNFLSERDLTLKDVANLKFLEQDEHFLDFLSYVKTGAHTGRYKEVKNNTANSYLETVFGLYQFLEKDGTIPYLKVLSERSYSYTTAEGRRANASGITYDGYLKSNESRGRCATKDQVKMILQNVTNNRDRLIIMIMIDTGMRIGETLGIRYTHDIDYEKQAIIVRYRTDNENGDYAKYAEERRIKVSPATFSLINVYLSEQIDVLENTDYLFVVLHGKTKGSPLSESAFYSSLCSIGKKCGFTVTNHMLRHFFANERRKAGWMLPEISKTLGHKHLQTTEHYLDVEDEELRDAQEKYFKENIESIPISDFL
jgi:integrase